MLPDRLVVIVLFQRLSWAGFLAGDGAQRLEGPWGVPNVFDFLTRDAPFTQDAQALHKHSQPSTPRAPRPQHEG